MKNTLLITKFFPPSSGGIQNYLFNLCKNLEKDKIFVLTKKSYKNLEEKKDSRIKKYYYKANKFHSLTNLTLLPILQKTKKIIKEKNIQTIVLGHFYIPYAITAILLKIFKNIPYIIFTHGLEVLETSKSKKANYILGLCLKHAQNIIVTTDYLRNKIIAKYPDLNLDKKIIKIPPGVDSSFFKPNINTNNLRSSLNLENKKILFTCSRLVKRKNHELIIRALPEIIKKIPNLIYLIGGEGPEKNNLEKLVTQLKLDNYVKFIGKIDNKDLPLYYNLADIFCMPSIHDKKSGDVEGFGLVFLEAQSSGTPTIGSHTGGIPDAIRNNIDGYLIDPNSSQELATKLIKLLQDDNLSQSMSKSGREKVIKEHNWGELAKKLPL